MNTAYQIFRVLAVLFGLSVTLSVINAMKGGDGSDLLPALFACIVFVGLSIYFGKKVKQAKAK